MTIESYGQHGEESTPRPETLNRAPGAGGLISLGNDLVLPVYDFRMNEVVTERALYNCEQRLMIKLHMKGE